MQTISSKVAIYKGSTLKFKKTLIISSLFLVSLLFFIMCSGQPRLAETEVVTGDQASLIKILRDAGIREYHYQVMHVYPHSTSSFTEGLVYENGYLYESTGLYSASKLLKIEITTGKILEKHSLPSQYFGEGLTIFNKHLYQLTYQEHRGFVYDKKSFHLKNYFTYPNQGWGLTSDDKSLIMSDGTSNLSFLNPTTFKPMRSVSVRVKDNQINHLNELEYIDGIVYANVWPTSIILLISPQTAKVQGWLNLAPLKPARACFECVANGIAFREADKMLFLTGKNWPRLYAVKIRF
jgi:glutamine cyclotransferase